MLSFAVTFVCSAEISENVISLTFLDDRRYLFICELLKASFDARLTS